MQTAQSEVDMVTSLSEWLHLYNPYEVMTSSKFTERRNNPLNLEGHDDQEYRAFLRTFDYNFFKNIWLGNDKIVIEEMKKFGVKKIIPYGKYLIHLAIKSPGNPI